MKCTFWCDCLEPDCYMPTQSCENEAEFIACRPCFNNPVCREHKCRCTKTIERYDAERAPLPAHWMAL
jgi:hypothetical protein